MSFKVWIEIEREKSNGDYEQMDAPGASVADFRTYQQAYDFAQALTDVAEGRSTRDIKKLIDERPMPNLRSHEGGALLSAVETAIADQWEYQQNGDPYHDYGDEWPEVARTKAQTFK